MAIKISGVVCTLLFRLLLFAVLLTACLVRYNVLSFIYLVFLLILPLLNAPTIVNIKGGTGVYLILQIVISGLGTLAHIVFHITLAAIATDDEPYGYSFSNCSTNEKIARTIAVERLDGVPFIHVLRLVIPDVAVLAASILTYVICRKFLTATPNVEQQSESAVPLVTTRSRSRQRVDTVLHYIGEFLVVLFLAACGIIVPSLIGAIYFLSFLFIATWWSFYRRLGRKFSVFRVFVLVWSGLHLLVLYLCQFQYVQDDLLTDNTSLPQRLLGLTEVVKVNCERPWDVDFHDYSNWPLFVNPALVLVLYFIVAVETRRWHLKKDPLDDADSRHVQRSIRKSRRQRSSERQVLPEHADQQESLVDAEQQQSYSTFEERQDRKSEEPGTPTMVDSDDEPDGGSEAKVKPKRKKKKREHVKRSALTSMFVYIMKQSYVLTLIAMMAWSITFHSWLAFVLLLAACFIWMVPQSRRACLLCSPVIMFYGEALLIIQYIYGLNLTKSELPDKIDSVSLEEIGLKRHPYPCLALGLQVLFTAMFWLAVRQFMREKLNSFPSDEQEVQMHALDKAPQGGGVGSWLSSYVWEFLAKYWIFVCSGMMLIISVQDVVIYRIIYLFLFLYFVLAFQLCYKIWRLTMLVFWWVVIVYSMIVLIVLYTYQFKDFPGYWKKTGLSDQVLADIGLKTFDIAGLFTQLLTPTSFLIVIILQVHYFHKRFLIINNIERSIKEEPSLGTTTETEGATTTETDSKILRKTKRWRRKFHHYYRRVWERCSEIWGIVSAILWRIMEIHVVKIVAFVIIMVCVTEVSCISAVYVILISLFLPITGAWQIMSHICQIWTAIVLLAKMIYQLNIAEKDYWNSNCTGVNASVDNITINNAEYVGMDKSDNFLYYARNYIGILLIIAFERIVYYHQYQYYNQSGMPRPIRGIIFPDVKRKDADKGLLPCAKFFANYFFYKYGLEICYIMFAATISIRVDVFSVIYAIILGVLLLLSRQGNARIWPLLSIVLALLLPIQYLMVLGMPKGLCYDYPWDNANEFDRNLEKWLFLPDFDYPPQAFKLVADFFLLLFVCLQWLVFRMEASFSRDEGMMEEYGGGDNSDILPEVEANLPVPVEDFTSHIHSYLDVIKNGFFTYMFWATLFIVFIAGTIRINMFSFGYVIAVFCFMWYGQEFIIYPLRTVRRKWKYLIFYTFFVLLLKAALQLISCVYISEKYLDLYNKQCWIVQLLGLTCLSPSRFYSPGSPTVNCVVEEDNTGLMWDVVCFTFLLLQLRIYNSQYFRHVVASTQAQNNLSSRGAELINNILIQEVKEQREREVKVLQKIKKKMHILKTKQMKSAKADYVEPDEHFQAIRSGDYYLFEEEDMDEADPTSLSLGRDTSDSEEEGLDPIKLISTAIESGTDAAVKQSDDTDEEEKKKEKKEDGGEQKEEEEEKDDEEEEEGEKEPSKLDKIKNVFILLCRLLESLADTLISIFNDISQNYRLVADSLEGEMKAEKEKIRLSKAEVKVKEQTITMESSTEEDAGASADEDGKPSQKKDTELVEIEIDVPEGDGTDDTDGKRPPAVERVDSETKREKFEKSKPKIFQLLEATYYVIVARSELVCYFLMILNVIVYASLLALPLPLMVFLWGMLSVPRPSKTFWITVITYTEAVVVVKYLFQFGFFPWNEQTYIQVSPFWPPRIIGIEQRSHYATADLVLLLALFIHRSILKRYGLWKDAEDISADLSKAEEQMSVPTTPVPQEITSTEDSEGDKPEQKEAGIEPSAQSSSGDQIDSSTSIEEGGLKKKKQKEKARLKVFLEPFQNFYQQLTNPAYNATTDVYASMFLCDFINFIIIVLGYSAFGPVQSTGSGDVTSYLTDDKVPVPFLIMLLAQFFLIVIDRALYLRKNVMGKFIYQIILVIVIHVWMFFILPYVTERKFSENTPAQLFYFVKCVYFALSAYQIRSSYPTRILGNFLTKKYNYLNLFLFKGFLAIPFLLELRIVMDWMWTDSTLAIGSWLQMEDIYANIYILKCWREAERKYPTPRSVKKRALVKYGIGGLLLVLIIFIIWFPLVVFSFANTVFVANLPVEVSTTIAIGGYQPLFQVQAQGNNIQTFDVYKFKSLLNNFKGTRSVTSFLNAFEYNDLCSVSLNGQSTSNWGISPPSKVDLINSLNDTGSKVTIEFDITFRREPTSGETGQTLSNQYILTLKEKTKKDLMQMIQNPLSAKETKGGVNIEHLFPKFFHLTSKTSHEESMLQEGGRTNITVLFKRDNSSGVENEWWEVQERLCGSKTEPHPCNINQATPQEEITLVALNDRVAPAGVFSKLTGYGIIGLYISFILLIGRILRLSTTGLQEGITFKELPYVDNILRLCLDIYLVREMVEFRLEEDLYAKLIFIYRSPETRIKWTRLPRDLIVTDAKKND